MTQTDRVLAALQAHPRGITQVDFLLPNVIDGGKPITRIGARILELRNAGHRVESDGRRDKCTVYKLSQERSGGGHRAVEAGPGAGRTPVAGAPEPGPTDRLFDPAVTHTPHSVYEDEAA